MRTILNVMCPEKQYRPVQAGVGALSHSESGHGVLFSPQDFFSTCELVCRSHNTRTLRAGVRIIGNCCSLTKDILPCWKQCLKKFLHQPCSSILISVGNVKTESTTMTVGCARWTLHSPDHQYSSLGPEHLPF